MKRNEKIKALSKWFKNDPEIDKFTRSEFIYTCRQLVDDTIDLAPLIEYYGMTTLAYLVGTTKTRLTDRYLTNCLTVFEIRYFTQLKKSLKNGRK